MTLDAGRLLLQKSLPPDHRSTVGDLSEWAEGASSEIVPQSAMPIGARPCGAVTRRLVGSLVAATCGLSIAGDAPADDDLRRTSRFGDRDEAAGVVAGSETAAFVGRRFTRVVRASIARQ
jgi:hypothetical protein